MNDAPQAERYRLDIEGLRAIAVALVIAFHFRLPGSPGGFVGVDVFFVISGYLITGLLVRERVTTGSIDLWRFYGRRARRLLPASLLSTVVTLAVGAFLFSPPEMVAASKAAFASSIFVSNMWFLRATLDYFAPESALNPFLHTWSLSVEEQFYLVWPTLVLVFASSASRPRRLLRAIGATLLITFVACVVLTATRQPWAFYLAPTRAWEFALGGLFALPAIEGSLTRRVPARWLGAFGFVAIATSFFFIRADALFPGWIALWPALGATALLVAGRASAPSLVTRVLAARPMVWVGRRSYALYLWHWPAIVFADVLYPASLVAPLAALAVTSFGAAVSYRVVENPIRRSRWLAAARRRSVWFAGAMTATAATLSLVSVATFVHFARSAPQVAISDAINTFPAASGSGRNCLVPFVGADVTTCAFGATDRPAKTVVLFGDSHADHWSSPLIEIATKRGWAVVTAMKAFCPAADFGVYVERLQRVSDECGAWRAAAIDRIIAMHPDAVVIGEASGVYASSATSTRGPHVASPAEWSAALARTVERFDRAKLPVLLIRDTPHRAESASVCLARVAWRSGDEARCATSLDSAVDTPLAAAERETVARYARATYLDWTGHFCPSERCPAILDGVVVYRDTNHVSNAFALRLAPDLERALDRALARTD